LTRWDLPSATGGGALTLIEPLAVPAKFADSFLDSGFRVLYSSPTMFDTITAEISTATDKLVHLRRFL
jgi:hypothetical protein